MMALFVRLLLKANHKDTSWRGITVKQGQLVVGLNSLAHQTGISIRSLRTCLSRLEQGGEICKKATNKFTLITICNYMKYQVRDGGRQQTSDKQLTNERQQRKKEKKKKNISSPEEDDLFMKFWEEYPRKVNRPAA